jgi:hypothetical protein
VAWRRRAGNRPGRPRKIGGKRRQTAAGRRQDIDTGSALLRARKLAVTGREDLELNAASVLLGHEQIDRTQYDTLGEIALWLQTMARAWGGLGGVTGLWCAIIGGAVPAGFVRREDAGLAGLADGARRRLLRICRRLDGSRELVIDLAEGNVPEIILHVIERTLTEADVESLERLRRSLDDIGGGRRHRPSFSKGRSRR